LLRIYSFARLSGTPHTAGVGLKEFTNSMSSASY